MSTMDRITKKCYICGRNSEQTELFSTNSMGYSDLDFRPPEMERSTMQCWVEECPHCGYVASDISAHVGYRKFIESFIREDEYITCDGMNFKGELSRRFYKQYLLQTLKEDRLSAFHALHCVIWDCDDIRGQKKNAKICRENAIDLLLPLADDDSSEDSESHRIILLDMLRRSGDFESAIMYSEEWEFETPVLISVAKYEAELAEKRDYGRYTIGDALEAYPLPKYIYCSVRVNGWDRTYYYIAVEDIYAVGDKVLVPFGERELTGIIEVINYYEIDDVPFPVDKTRSIIQKETY